MRKLEKSKYLIPYARQDINQADIDAVVDVLRSDFLTQGPAVPLFENTVAESCAARYAVALSNASSALHIACIALGVSQGDVVWTTPITFVASANCALHCGADVDFVDIDPRTFNMSVERLAEKLEQAKKQDRLPKVVIPVHLCGQSCDMAGIHTLAQEYGFSIIEDASHAIGGRYRNEPIGSCRYSDIAVFSFHPVKVITSGEGGMVLTNSAELDRKMRLLRNSGISREASDMLPREPAELWNYQQIALGFNYRMTDIQAALGLSQLQRLTEFVDTRNQIADRYNELLASLPVVIPWQQDDSYSSFHLYVIRLKLGEINKSHREVYESLRTDGILVNLHYIPVYRQPYYESMGFPAGYCPEAEKYYSEAISLPMYPALTTAEQDQVLVALRKAVSA